jgi:WhiB family transcriptional regulator, redox-sensing transcriptional regulator
MAVVWSAPRPSVADWRHEAACRAAESDLFFPVGSTGPALRQIEAAKAVCRQCPAQAPCLDFALRTGQDAGVWGATSEEERRTIRRAHRRRTP